MRSQDVDIRGIDADRGLLLCWAAFIQEFGFEPNEVHIGRTSLRELIPLKLGDGVPGKFYGIDIVVHEDDWIGPEAYYLVAQAKE